MELLHLTSCPICNAVARQRIGLRGDRPIPQLTRVADVTVTVWRCRSCGHYWADPVPSEAELARLYASAADDYLSHIDTGGSGTTVDTLVSSLTPGRVLDLGCGSGRVMRDLVERGWEAAGTEPHPEFSRLAARHGVVAPTLADLEGPFDLVLANFVLEHVADPVGMLRDARRLTVPGGFVLAQVPNGRRPEAWLMDRVLRLRGRPWTVRTAPLQTPFHLAEFSPRSLETAARRAGWSAPRVEVAPGRTPYPLPRPAAVLVRALEIVGTALGHGHNLALYATNASDHAGSDG